ncbi:MAG: hypothetical protein GXP08_14405 [Gammaproteobacteria bacterium]|nr:hypothetical protein [Gammaproteobacteria bacterium]
MKIHNKRQKQAGLTITTVLSVISLLLVGSISTTTAGPVERTQAKRIHDRLIGVPPTDADLAAMEALMADPVQAARYAISNSSRRAYFYNVSLKNFITPWTNEAQTAFAPLNDYTATVIGIVRDDKDFRQILSGNEVYVGTITPSYARTNNDHYEALEANNIDLSDPSNLTAVTQASLGMAGSSTDDSAGVITTRAAGQAFFKAGTNRAMLRFTLMNHMCRDLEHVKDITGIPDRIRQDVSRSPGGDSSIFLNSCIGCHAGMDPLTSAFAYYEWVEEEDGSNGQVVYSGDPAIGVFVQPKYHINRSNFEYGYITRDDSWENYWRKGPNANLGWSQALPNKGTGAKSVGAEFANSEAFAQCQVEKVYRHVCFQEPIANHSSDIEQITAEFMGDYNLKEVFAKTAVLCMGE